MSKFDYIDNNFEKRRYWVYSQGLHKQKLEQIKLRPKFDTPCTGRSISTSKANRSTKVKGFLEKVRDTSIRKGNEMLLHKLVEIAGRSKTKRATYTPGPRRLSMSPAQKREAMRIEQENTRLAKKIMDPNTSFKLKKWNEDYRQTLKYKQLLARPHLQTSIDFPVSRQCLPPLSAEVTADERISLVEDVKVPLDVSIS